MDSNEELDVPEAVKFIVEHKGYQCVCTPSCIHEYSNCRFEAGTVTGHPDDSFYFHLERNDDDMECTILLKPDEMLSLAWVLTGALATHNNLEWNIGEEE